MKQTVKALLCMGIIFTALCAICQHFNGFAPAANCVHYSQQLTGLKEWAAVFIVVAFFTGFLPAYIHEIIKAMQPAPAPRMEQKSQVNHPAPAPAVAMAAAVAIAAATPAEPLPAMPTQRTSNSAPAQAAEAPQTLYIGQTFTSAGSNCTVRIKALKMAA